VKQKIDKEPLEVFFGRRRDLEATELVTKRGILGGENL
jgi:hypothetical protein